MAYITTSVNGTGKQYKVTYDMPKIGGKRRRKSKTFPVGTSFSTVKAFKNKVEQQSIMGELDMIQDRTIEEAVNIYLDNYSYMLSPTTRTSYLSRIYCTKDDKGILSYFKDCYINKITPQMVQEYVTYLLSKKNAPKTVRNYILVLDVITETSENLGFIREGSNPVKKIKLPSKKAIKKVTVYTTEEIRTLLTLAKEDNNHNMMKILILGALCGLRRGEMAGLKWENVRLDGGFTELYVEQTIVQANGKVYIKPPKTENGVRTVPFGRDAADILRKERDIYRSKVKSGDSSFTDSGYVFFDFRTGDNLMPTALNSCYIRFMKKHEDVIGFKSLHSLRHTFASLIASSGANPKSLQTLLGHSDPAFSLSQYTHSYTETLRCDTDILNETIFGKDDEARSEKMII